MHHRLVLSSIGLLLAYAVGARPSSGMEMQMMPAVGPIFVENRHFSTDLHLVNELNTILNVTVHVYSLGGKEVLEKGLVLAPYSDRLMPISTLLTSASVNLEMGSIRVMSDHDAGLLGALSFKYVGSSVSYFDEELAMPNATQGSTTLRGVADDVSTYSPITAITSLATTMQRINITCIQEGVAMQSETICGGPLG